MILRKFSVVALMALVTAVWQPNQRVSATTLTNGLVVHLKFDGDLQDSTANGINGTNMALGTVESNGVTFATGFLGQAVHVNASADGTTNNYVSLGYPELLHFGSDATGDTTDFSVSMWVRIFSSQADEPLISNKNWDSSGNLGWVISNESDGTRVQLTDDVNGNRNIPAHAGPQLEDGQWHNLCVTVQRTNLVGVYVDGALLSSFSIAPALGNGVGNLDTDTLTVTRGPGWAVNLGEDGTGLYAVNNGASLDCLMDDVGIWRRAITAGEALEIYNKGAISGKTLEQDPGVLFTVIVTQPTNITVAAGVPATFAVTAAGQAPLTYQWLKNGTLISTATNATYKIPFVAHADAGTYAVVVSGPGGTKTSNPATLVVTPPAQLCPLTEGLAAYLHFDGSLMDSTTNQANGTAASGNITYSPGVVGQAVHVISTGDLLTNDYVTLNYPDSLKFTTNDFTICFWAKLISQNDDKPFISNKNWNSGGNLGWVLATQGGGMKWNFKDDTSSRRDSGTYAGELLDRQWHHIAVVFQRTNLGSIYVDSNLENAANVAPDAGNPVGNADTDSLGLAINIGQDGTGNYTDGGGMAAIDALIDELAIWQRALTASEIACVYTHGAAGLPIDAANIIPITIDPPSASSGNFNINWFGNANSYVLQEKLSLSDANWINVQTNSSLSAKVPIASQSGFFRVVGH